MKIKKEETIKKTKSKKRKSKKVLEKPIKKPGRKKKTKEVDVVAPEKIPDVVLEQFKEKMKKVLAKSPRRRKKSRGEKLKYNKKMCYKVLDLYVEGKNTRTVATELGISYVEFYKWQKLYVEFKFACKLGLQLSYRYWVELGRINVFSKDFNHVLWMMNMTNRFKWLSSNSKEEKRVKKIDKKVLELKIDENRLARIVDIAKNNETIIEAREITGD